MPGATGKRLDPVAPRFSRSSFLGYAVPLASLPGVGCYPRRTGKVSASRTASTTVPGMNTTHLGASGLKVSRLCLGTMNFGPRTPEDESHAIMDRALDEGINFFDTANVYGGDRGRGATEEIVGNWIAKDEGRRDAIVLATKAYNPSGTKNDRPEVNRDSRGLSALKLIRDCEASLKRLKTDRIDLYQMHHIDRSCPVDEIWEAMDTLRKQGKIVYVGSSNFAGWDIATYCQHARNRGKPGLVSEQSVYNLLNRTVELEVIPAARHYGLGLIPWSPLAGGVLGGVMKTESKDGRRAGEGALNAKKKHGDALDAYEAHCEAIGQTPANVALAWLLHNPVVTAPIIGPRTVAQLEEALPVPEIGLSDETLAKLDELFPGPGGEAPNAYAW